MTHIAGNPPKTSLSSLVGTIFTVRWQPTRATAIAVVSYLLVVLGMVTAFQVFTTANVAANFITFGPVTLAVLGVAVPVFYTVLARRRPLADLGLTTQRLIVSIVLGLALGLLTYQGTLATINVTLTPSLVPMILMALSVGLFEAIFFRGWLQLRFEAAFGLIPGAILAALCYSLHHVGYGMTPGELLFLFGLGLIYAAVFRLTRNVFVLWPFFTPPGGLFTTLQNGLTLPFEASYGFILTLAFMAYIIAMGAWWLPRKLAARSSAPAK